MRSTQEGEDGPGEEQLHLILRAETVDSAELRCGISVNIPSEE